MPCYAVVRKKAAKLGIAIPEMTDQEVRDVVGAIDHEDLHRIIDGMSNEQIADLAKRLLARKKKRAEVLQNYIALQAGVA